MLRKTVTIVNGGPKGGKTTLTAQAAASHIHYPDDPFWVPGFAFPTGKIVWVQTDRAIQHYEPIFKAVGIWGHPDLQMINFLNDRSLHRLTRPGSERPEQECNRLEILWRAIIERMEIGLAPIGTIILDLYPQFITGDTKSGYKNSYYGRENLLHAMDLDVAILGIVYPFKQTTTHSAMRAQDRTAGSLMVQASTAGSFTIIDAEELGEKFGMIEAKPGSGEGSTPVHLPCIRGTAEEGDPIGLFRPYDDKRLEKDDEREPWKKRGISRATYYRRKKEGKIDESDEI